MSGVRFRSGGGQAEVIAVCSNPSVNPSFETFLQIDQDLLKDLRGQSVDTRHKSPLPRRLKRHLDSEAIATIVAGYEAGLTATELGAQFGIHRTTVVDLLKRNEVSVRRQSLTPKNIELAEKLYGQGFSLETVGPELGCSGSTVWWALTKAGVAMRDHHGQERKA